MKKIMISVAVVFLVISGYGIYQMISSPKPESKTISIDTAVNQLVEDENQLKEIEKLSGDELLQQREIILGEMLNRYSKPESAIEYLFSVAMKRDLDLYPDAFIGKTFDKDIFDHPQTNKMDLGLNIMDRLTKNGTVEKIDIVKGMWTLEKDSVRVIADLWYKGESDPVRINVLVRQLQSDYHQNHGDEQNEEPIEDWSEGTEDVGFYYVETSVWKILSQIEGGN